MIRCILAVVIVAAVAGETSTGATRAQSGCSGGPLTCALVLSDPLGVAVGAGGQVYIADAGADQILKLSPHGKVLATWGGEGKVHGLFDLPTSVAAASPVGVYVADVRNHRIEKLTPSGNITQSVDTPIFLPWWYSNPIWTPFLVRVATDTQRNLYVFDATMRLSKFGPSGRLKARWRIQVDHSGGSGMWDPEPYSPLAVAIGPGGTIYVSFEARGPDNRGGAPDYLYVQGRNQHGKILKEWQFEQAYPNARPVVATGLAVTSKATVWMTDGANHAIVELSRRGVVRLRLGSLGCGPGRFIEPSGIAVDNRDRLYVVDRGAHSLQELTPRGKPLAFWGNCGAP